MLQHLATPKLDIAAPAAPVSDTDVQNNEVDGSGFSKHLADVQANTTSRESEPRNYNRNNDSASNSVQAPQEDDALVADGTEVGQETESQSESDNDLFRFLQRVNGANGNYDPAGEAGKKQNNGVLQNTTSEETGKVSEELLNARLENGETALINVTSTENLAGLNSLAAENEELVLSEEDENTLVEPIELDLDVVILDVHYEFTDDNPADQEPTESEDIDFSELVTLEENNDDDELDVESESIDDSNAVTTSSSANETQPVNVQPIVNQTQPDTENTVNIEPEVTPVDEVAIQSLLEQTPQQQENTFNQISAIAGLNAAEKAAKDFVSALKAGLDDIKSQAKAGQDIGSELSQLVSQVTESLQESGQLTEQQANQVSQSLGQVTQSILAQGELASQSNLSRGDGRSSSSLGSIEQLEANKVAQQNTAFDKAVNLAKPEAAVQLAEKVVFAVNARNLVADIRLDPADLGSIQARVSLQGDQASVNFVTQSQQARDLLEQQTPKLRELLDEQGIELGQSSVQQESQQAEDGRGTGQFANAGTGGTTTEDNTVEEAADEIGAAPVTNGHVGAIDYFV